MVERYGINTIRNLAIRNNVFRRNIEGEIMYNYKFDNDVSKRASSIIEQEVFDEKVVAIINSLKKTLSNIKYTPSVEMVLNKYCQDGLHRQNNSQKDMRVQVKFAEAFSKSEIDSFLNLSKNFDDKITSLEFELGVVNGFIKKCLSLRDMRMLIVYKDKASSILSELDSEFNKLSEINKDIVVREKEFLKNLKEFVGDLKKSKKWSAVDVSSRFDERVVDMYKNLVLIDFFENLQCQYGEGSLKIFLERDDLKDYLQDKILLLKSWFGIDVGTDF